MLLREIITIYWDSRNIQILSMGKIRIQRMIKHVSNFIDVTEL